MKSTGLTTYSYSIDSGTSGSVNITTSRTRLKALVVTLVSSNSAGTTGDGSQRILDLYDASSGDSMIQFCLPRRSGGRDRSGEVRFIDIPGNGLLFPGGIKLTRVDIYKQLVFVWQGPGDAI
jgi:hypothetical protein